MTTQCFRCPMFRRKRAISRLLEYVPPQIEARSTRFALPAAFVSLHARPQTRSSHVEGQPDSRNTWPKKTKGRLAFQRGRPSHPRG
jgi:hypothetical protein